MGRDYSRMHCIDRQMYAIWSVVLYGAMSFNVSGWEVASGRGEGVVGESRSDRERDIGGAI